MSTEDRAPEGSPRGAVRQRSRTERARLIVAFALGALAVVFAVLNLGKVNVNWIIGVWRTPLIVVIVVGLLLGTVIGWIAASRRP